jgi:hypothetical protein
MEVYAGQSGGRFERAGLSVAYRFGANPIETVIKRGLIH